MVVGFAVIGCFGMGGGVGGYLGIVVLIFCSLCFFGGGK